MFELWKQAIIEEANCTYEVSTNGEIRNILSKQKLTLFDNGRGYLTFAVWIKNNTIRKKYYIHRIVAQTFIENPENKKYVNHKDGDKSNNCVDNLEWVTSSENNKHKYRVLKCPYPKRKFFTPPVKVRCIETGIIYKSVHEAARQLNIDPRNISRSKNSNGKYLANNCHWEEVK